MKWVRWFIALDRQELVGVMLVALFGLALSLGPLAVSFAISPEDIESGRVTLSRPCEYRSLRGEPCPTCGMTRAFCALSRGRWRDALALNANAPWAYAAFWLVGLASAGLMGAALRRYPSATRFPPHLAPTSST